MADVTQILQSIDQGDRQAAEELLPLVYEELRKLAAARMAQESPDHTLQPTALVHEAYLRLVGSGDKRPWESRGHFFAAAAEAMRRILVDSARRKQALKRGGDLDRSEFDPTQVPARHSVEELLAIDEALDRLAEEDAQAAELVKLRYFSGLSIPQAASVLGVSPRTADRLWAFAKAWLSQQLRP